MRILLLTDEIWNDRVFGNNVLQNWFEGLEGVVFAQICATPGKPLNTMCTLYFQITDTMVLRSILGPRAGQAFEMSYSEMLDNPQTRNYIAESGFYRFMKRISGETLRLVRECLWGMGRIDFDALSRFVKEFNPDIVFCPRRLTWKMMRLEKLVSRVTVAPFVAFTGDDEVSFREYSFSPLFWINRFIFRKAFRRHCGLYKAYYTLSADQADEYRNDFRLNTDTLLKCGDFKDDDFSVVKHVGEPIRLIYAGRLYCNRWRSLAHIGKALRKINEDGVRMVLDIYTQDKLTAKQRKALAEDNYIYLKGSVTTAELKEVYRQGDIALHVESLDRRNRLLTRISFSTKIIDLMASTCAIMAICWSEHTGYKYLKTHDAAFCIDSYEDIYQVLKGICDDPALIHEYAHRAWYCGMINHSKEEIQNHLIDAFSDIIKGN